MTGGTLRGTRLEGSPSGEDTARVVERMFSSIAARYDFLNHLLSFELDRLWRRRAAGELRTLVSREKPVTVDLCCGTGDMGLSVARSLGGVVIGIDFSRPMLERARAKATGSGLRFLVCQADALHLPLPDACADAVVSAFGFRNLVDYPAGLREMWRVLRPGGVASLLEFSRPRSPVVAWLYRLYSHRVLPIIGGWISGSRTAYEYLPASVDRFPCADRLAAMMREAGFAQVRFRLMTSGIVALHTGLKPEQPS